jgi:phycoerythrin-associated linker protein
MVTMDITQFVEQSIGRWKSQRSAHHLIFGHFEAVRSTIDIERLSADDPAVIDLCQANAVDLSTIAPPFRMTWEGESDWDDAEVMKGTTVLVPIPDPTAPDRGRLLRDQGYAETIPAVGHYRLTDGVFVLVTEYDRAAAEEKIWFGNPNLRFRVSLIKTSDGAGVVTASFSSEIRDLSDR